MSYVIRAIGFANGTPCPHAGEWLKSFDHNALDGRGYGVFTSDPAEAMRFNRKIEAMVFCWKQSAARPFREDGEPNRPLSALDALIEELPE